MTIHHGRHGGEEPTWAFLSDDAGATWRRLPNDFPLLSRDARTGLVNETHDSGVTGHLRDSFVRINHSTEHALSVGYDRAHGPYHDQFQEEDPTFRFHRWTADATPIESFPFKVRGMPWNRASYQCYSRLLELDDGDFLTALEWVRIVPESEWQTLPNGRVRKTITSVFIVRSSDRGKSWDFVHAFDAYALKPTYGPADRRLDEGFNEADLVQARQRRSALHVPHRLVFAHAHVALRGRRAHLVDPRERRLAGRQAAAWSCCRMACWPAPPVAGPTATRK